MLIIDTPGHESFNNLRARGSSLADIAILVVDVMHGLEPQTIESLNMLRKRRCPFVIALNKVDRLYQWKDTPWSPIQQSMEKQADYVQSEFDAKWSKIKLELAERGINTDLYYEQGVNARSTILVVPTSAMTGEGIPDLLYVMLNITQKIKSMKKHLNFKKCMFLTVILFVTRFVFLYRYVMLNITQKMMAAQLTFRNELQVKIIFTQTVLDL